MSEWVTVGAKSRGNKKKQGGKSTGKVAQGALQARSRSPRLPAAIGDEFIQRDTHVPPAAAAVPREDLEKLVNFLPRLQTFLDEVVSLDAVKIEAEKSSSSSSSPEHSPMHISLLASLLSSLPVLGSIDNLAIYGVGSVLPPLLSLLRSSEPDGSLPSPSPNLLTPSVVQLLIALRLSTRRVDSGEAGSGTTVYFDPVMTEPEMEFLELLNIIPLTSTGINGDFTAEGRVVYFMPHCPEALYAAVLAANAGHLDKVTIVGNSLSDYTELLRPNGKKCPEEIIAAVADSRFEAETLRVLGGGVAILDFCGTAYKLDRFATADGTEVAERVYSGMHHTCVMTWGKVVPEYFKDSCD